VTLPDPEKAFVAYLRTALTGVTVGDKLINARPMVVVNLVPGSSIQVRGYIDRVRIDLVCYGPDPRGLAAQVREAILHGFTAGGGQAFSVVPDPAYPLPDPYTFEDRFYVPTTASVYQTA
jgi:hypothetical protein